jgi:TIR domain
MAADTSGSSRIFISYRRQDSAYPAGWLFDQLESRFGKGQVFKDVDSIQPGDDFFAEIEAAIAACGILLVVIGSRWLTVAGESGRRLDDPTDFVRLEIEAALHLGIRIIPVLVDGAQMPRADELPVSLASVARRQAIEFGPKHFKSDLNRLISKLEAALTQIVRTPQPVTSSPAETPVTSSPAEGEIRQPRHATEKRADSPVARARPRAEPISAEMLKAQREISKRLKQGEIGLPEILEDRKTDDAIGAMKVSDLLESLPGVGKVYSRRMMEVLGISEKLTARRLGVHQQAALNKEFGANF